MNDLTWTDGLDSRNQGREQRTIVVDPVFGDVNDHDSECELSEIVLEFEAPINCHKGFEAALSKLNDLVIRRRSPASLNNSHGVVSDERLANARVHAFV